MPQGTFKLLKLCTCILQIEINFHLHNIFWILSKGVYGTILVYPLNRHLKTNTKRANSYSYLNTNYLNVQNFKNKYFLPSIYSIENLEKFEKVEARMESKVPMLRNSHFMFYSVFTSQLFLFYVLSVIIISMLIYTQVCKVRF